MVKISTPLMSVDASGSIAHFITFSKRKSGQQVRWQKKQKDVSSALRVSQRFKFFSSSFAVRFSDVGLAECGISICGLDIEDLNINARGKVLSGYNLGIKQNIKEF